jgi:hypothetical protein
LPRGRLGSLPACSAGPLRVPRRRLRSPLLPRTARPPELPARSRLRPRHPAPSLPWRRLPSRGRANTRN